MIYDLYLVLVRREPSADWPHEWFSLYSLVGDLNAARRDARDVRRRDARAQTVCLHWTLLGGVRVDTGHAPPAAAFRVEQQLALDADAGKLRAEVTDAIALRVQGAAATWHARLDQVPGFDALATLKEAAK